ncbi:MAG: hypothetical protein JNL11_19370 [Bdellovibrionaceae bacterium]|nr:hypothetical protein [Pseudobdellovibrionaceae bacterium]
MSVDKNFEFFKRELPIILNTHRGQFVLIKDEKIVSFYISAESALKDAYQRFQDNDFLIQEVTDEDRVNYINSAFLQR